MNFYIFNSKFELLDEIEEAGFVGNLFVYHTSNSDPFTKIARDVDVHKKIKYMVAIRPYAISPEYLVMIHKSIKEIAKESRLQINLISGHIKPDELETVRTLGPINNQSSHIERSQYLIEYVELLNTLPNYEKPDFYISTTNEFTFNLGSKYNNKMIIPYSDYLNSNYDLSNKKIMIALTPVVRETQLELDNLGKYNIQHKADLKTFTYESLRKVVNDLRREGIREVIFSAWNDEDTKEIINFVKDYNLEKRYK